MDSSLETYWKKRDFSITAEPRGKVAEPAEGLGFVVQKHAASRLHYDFRLELDGTLKSWAVPKGPSLDPTEKRMAVQVEDHPLAYASFEGVIPPGQYGAGTVIVWDRGTWIPIGDPREGYRSGKLKFELRGEKLRGHWTLVRMHAREKERQIPWLLIKERDDEAKPASEFNLVEAFPESVLTGTAQRSGGGKDGGNNGGNNRNDHEAGGKIASREPAPTQSPGSGTESMPANAKPAGLPVALAPQLATLVDSAPPGNDWLYEIKFDGYRVLTRIDGGDVRLFTRAGNDWTGKFRKLAGALAELKLPSGWIDGEIVITARNGRSDFQALQNAIETSAVDSIQYYVFDLPFFDGYDLREATLTDRRALLRSIMNRNSSGLLRFSEDFEATPEELLGAACKLRLEGVIGKKADAPYVSTRTRTWVKLKCTQRQEFVVGGYTDPKGKRQAFGALLLGVNDERGRLVYVGNVGTGFDEKSLASLKNQLDALAVEKAPFDPLPRGVKGRWVKPRLVAEVSFTEWTGDGYLIPFFLQ